MCLGIPGKVIDIVPGSSGITMGKVSFGGIVKEVCLAYTPDVELGGYVIVHAGFAISQLNEAEAMEIFDLLHQIAEASEDRTTETPV